MLCVHAGALPAHTLHLPVASHKADCAAEAEPSGHDQTQLLAAARGQNDHMQAELWMHRTCIAGVFGWQSWHTPGSKVSQILHAEP